MVTIFRTYCFSVASDEVGGTISGDGVAPMGEAGAKATNFFCCGDLSKVAVITTMAAKAGTGIHFQETIQRLFAETKSMAC